MQELKRIVMFQWNEIKYSFIQSLKYQGNFIEMKSSIVITWVFPMLNGVSGNVRIDRNECC